MDTLPPGPSQAPLLQTTRWLVRPIAFMQSARRRFGDTFTVRFTGFQRPMVMISDPDAIRALYTAPEHELPPGRSLTLMPIMGSRSVLLLQGTDHLARRRLMLPLFHGERMRSYESIVREVAEREVDTWTEDRPLAIHPRMQAITLEVIMRAVFGVTDPVRRQQLGELLPMLLGDSSSIWLQMRVLLSRGRSGDDPLASLRDLVERIDELLLAEISQRRKDPGLHDRDDILSLMVQARFEDGSGMSDRDIRDQLVTLLLAGHETTATALAWTFDLLLGHPETLEKLTREVAAADDDAYLKAVISESLRLRPVVPIAGRRLVSDLAVDGLRLPAGTDVTPAIWLTHTRPDLYPEPFRFRPERFLDDAPTTYGWIPFGGGIRRCLGAAFAEFEIRTVLETVLSRRVLHRASDHAERVMRRNVTFSPRHGTRVLVGPRSEKRAMSQ